MSTSHSSLFDAMPGVTMSLSRVTEKIHEIWYPPKKHHSDDTLSRASQLNLVVHLGLRTELEEGREIFQTAMDFAQDHPCRIIVLCPTTEEPTGDTMMLGKLYTLCYLDSGSRNVCCCEALILKYPVQEAGYVDDQLTLWIENDLPTYYWPHKLPLDRIQLNYLPFIESCRRVIYDPTCGDAELAQLEKLTDTPAHSLCWRRLLPLRQSMGSFLAAYSPKNLIKGLGSITIAHKPEYACQALALQAWFQESIKACRQKVADDDSLLSVPFQLSPSQDADLKITWHYASEDKFFRASFTEEDATLRIEAQLDRPKVSTTTKLHLLSAPKTLAEAIFF